MTVRLRKVNAALTCWLKEMAPSPGPREWFGHDSARYREFARRYRAELNLTASPDVSGFAAQLGKPVHGAQVMRLREGALWRRHGDQSADDRLSHLHGRSAGRSLRY